MSAFRCLARCKSHIKISRRSLCSQKGPSNGGSDICDVSLTKALPGFPAPVYAKPTQEDDVTRVTTLSNGMKVASHPRFGAFCTVGVVIDSGSRYETLYPSGISHFLERLAFGGTKRHKDKNAVLFQLEKEGGICDCQGTRDTTIYAASANSKGLDNVVSLLSEVVLRPRFETDEIENARATIHFELEDISMKPDQEQLLFEMIHAAAYSDNTLGLPKLCPLENIEKIDRKVLYSFMSQYFRPERMVLAGVGVEHEKLVESAQKYFVDDPAIWVENPSLIGDKTLPIDNSLSQYTGGIVKIEKDLSDMSLGQTPIPDLAHFVLGLESCSHQDDDFIAFCVLNTMMGGGGSFSAGGPGKGMYTRLYTNVLNRFHWMYNATAYNHAYGDSGLFCIHASADPSQLRDVVDIVVHEFSQMQGQISKSELNRAKTQLKSMLLMNLEARPVLFEDVGRQVLASGQRKNASYYIQHIDKITEEDIHRVVGRMLRSRASVAALGNLKALPALEDVEVGLVNKDGRLPNNRRFSLFR